MLKSGKKSLDFHSRFINNLLFSKTSPVQESNSVPSTVNKQLLQISTVLSRTLLFKILYFVKQTKNLAHLTQAFQRRITSVHRCISA